MECTHTIATKYHCMHAYFCIFLHIPVLRLHSSAHRSVLHGTWKRTLHGMLRDVVISRSPRELHDLQGQTVKHCEASMEASGATTLSAEKGWDELRMEMNWWETWETWAVTDEFHLSWILGMVCCGVCFSTKWWLAPKYSPPLLVELAAGLCLFRAAPKPTVSCSMGYDWYIGI